ncbi:MAG: VOC family protein, partial [Actinobacteria bacterium]|nr:VOC family protein [Actinomycetota bacterium]
MEDRGEQQTASGADVSDLVPLVHVADIERSIAFYERLGFEVRSTYEARGRAVWAALENATARLELLARQGVRANRIRAELAQRLEIDPEQLVVARRR